MKQKITTAKAAMSHVSPGMTVMVGGFGLVGSPIRLIEELARTKVGDLTIISNNIGEAGRGLGKLLDNGQVKKAIGSFFTSNPRVGEEYAAGRIMIQLMPQGTFVEAIRAGGAGIGGFYTRASALTLLGEGKETRQFDGEMYVLERPLVADVAIIRAKQADRHGNLVYRKTARNFNPVMATAAKIVIAEVDDIVEVGELDPEAIVTPHLYVDWLVKGGDEGA